MPLSIFRSSSLQESRAQAERQVAICLGKTESIRYSTRKEEEEAIEMMTACQQVTKGWLYFIKPKVQ